MPRVVPSQVVELIDELFPQYREASDDRRLVYNQQMDRCYGLKALLDLTQQIAPTLIVLGSRDYCIYQSSIAAIRNGLDRPFNHGHGYRVELHPIPEYMNLNPIALIRDLLCKCPDEFPSHETVDLHFISDSDFRQSLRNDISGINMALANSEWKATTVLSGSVVEALLLWALQQKSPSDIQAATDTLCINKTLERLPPQGLDHWNLHQYIEV